MDRRGGWLAYFALSVIVMSALIDDFPIFRNGKKDFSLGTAAFTMIISFLYLVGNFVPACTQKLTGNLFELGITIFCCVLWVIAISFIQNPDNEMATSTSDAGEESILNANLYFFSWAAFLCSVYQVASSFEDRQQMDASLTRWFLLMATSVVLVANNTNTITNACDDEDKKTCYRTRYGIGVGALGIIFTSIMIILTFINKARAVFHISISFIMLVLYFFGVALLTSASGPARTLGNTYLSLWAGFWISFQTFFGFFNDRTKGNDQEYKGEGVAEPYHP